MKKHSWLHALIISILFSLSIPLAAQTEDRQGYASPQPVNKDHAVAFSRLSVQDVQGRIKPVDSLNMEILNKIAGERKMHGMDYNQIILGMLTDPQTWSHVPLIKVKHPEIKRIIGIGKNQKYASFSDFIDNRRTQPYKLNALVSSAMRKDQSQRTKLDKAVVKTEEVINITFMVFRGDLFRIFPVPGDLNNQWQNAILPHEGITQNINENQKLFASYRQTVRSALSNGDWSRADLILNEISSYQKTHAEHIIPSSLGISTEIFFNRFNIFDRLTLVYLLAGLTLLVISFIKIIMEKKIHPRIMQGLSVVIGAGFLFHTFGLGLRWYVSGHAPWSNGYESLIYIAWAMVLAGLFFGRNSSLALATAAIMSGLSLFVAHLSWMDPQITNLVPVLKSYWLTIHVSVISASYGFFSLGALLGLTALMLIIFRNEKKLQIDRAIRHILKIDEMTIMVGIALLSIGNLLGAVWANESWGRYWSWDPKETWTLVSIMVYAIILHFKYIPALNTGFLFAAASLWGFSTIIMTYFGVNYFLSGLHSYAGGDAPQIPSFIYFIIAGLASITVLAHSKRDSRFPFRDA
ncbi:MAG: cytochrome c biogenesis protein CcsA [Spirochaetia bacterium]|nr:cytochrome c biogenesis protein CcsA [Spirochaetia bacterium]